MSYSDELTEKELKKLEKTIAREYTKAWRELRRQSAAYFKQFEKRDAEMREALENGSYPVPVGMTAAAYYKQWSQNQMARGERWEKLCDNMANRIVNANKQAAAYVNDKTPSIYSLNYNYEAYQIEGITGARFDIYDEQTVKQLMLGENHIEFRTLNPNPIRDYAWNTKRINSELISGILQGKSIPQLTDGFMSVMQSNRKAAVRNARTAVTSAKNGGRMESYRRASEMGIEIQKEWMAAKDSRTRDSHAALDGVIVKYDEDFPNGLSYPGDPKGTPAEVYNCRCTMVARLPGYSNYSTDNTRTGNTVESYKRWLSAPNEMYRRKIDSQGNEIIDKATYSKLTKSFLKNDGIIIRGADAERHLGNHATAAYVAGANTAFIKDNATVSDVLEEMHHAYQDRASMYGKKITRDVFLRREIEAQEYMLKNADKYRIPQKEIDVTKRNLEDYRKRLMDETDK